MTIASSLTAQRVYVLDTSYLVGLFQRMLWTLGMKRLMIKDNADSIIPTGVEQEFIGLYKGLRGTSDDLSVEGSLFEQTARTGNFKIYCWESGIERLALGKNQDVKNTMALSRTDKGFIEEAVSLARNRRTVYAATSDFAIVKSLGELRDRENLELMIVSPWNSMTPEDFLPLELRLVITSGILKDLFNTDYKSSGKRYLAVARNMDIGSNVSCDISFGVYTKKSMYAGLPNMEGVYFIPLAFPNMNNNKIKIDWYYLGFARLGELVAYNQSTPGYIYPIRQTPLEQQLFNKLMILQSTNRSRPALDNLIPLLQVTGEEWARVEEWHLKKLNHTTAGKVDWLRHKLEQLH